MFSQDSGRSRSYRTLKSVAGVTSFAMTWLAVAPTAMAAMRKNSKPAGHTRQLNAQEMQRIWGAQTMPPDPTPDGGGGQGGNPNGWEGGSGGGSTTTGGGGTTTTGGGGTTTGGGGGGPLAGPGGSGTTNSINGNKVTNVPLVGWTAKGGLPLGLTLYHNSEGTYNGEFGQKWTFSWAIYLTENASTGDITVHHGDDLPHTFVKNMDGSFTPPAGVNDTVSQRYFVPPSQGGAQGGPSDFTYTVRGSGVVYHFNASGASAGKWVCDTITDANSNVVTIARDASTDGAQSVSDPSGRSLTFAYSGGKISSATDPLGRVWTFVYDTTTGDLTTITLPQLNGQTYSLGFGYNARHDITSQTDARGKTWTFTYNSDDSQASATDPLNHTTTWAYTSTSTITTDANGHAQTQTYDASGRLVSVTDALGHSTTYAYDADNNKITVTDALGNATHLTYNVQGDVLTATDPLNHTVSMTYNNRGQVLTQTTPMGHVTQYQYDAHGNLVSATDALGHASTLAYNTSGEPTSVSDALNHVTTLGYNVYGDVTSVTDPLNHVSTFAYDGLGRRTATTDATGKTSTSSYDEWGRCVSVSAPGGRTTSFVYDASGNRTGQTNPLGQTDTIVYDDLGRPISHTDALSRTVQFTYDAANRKTAFTDGNGHITGYAYDAANRKTGISYPDNTNETWAYQNNNRLLSHTDGRGVTGTNAYNAAGQVTGISYSDGTAGASVAYDADGRKTSMTDGTGTTTYAYDNGGRLTSRITPAGSVGFSYDAANRLTVRTLAGAGTTAFAYDAAGKMTSTIVPGASGAETTAYAYDNAGRLLTTTFANGDVEATAYDANTSDLASDVHTRANGSVITSSVYTYDNGGKKTSETDASGAVVSYGYDSAGQLTSEARTGTVAYVISYAYDNAGNRTSKTQNGVSEGYIYDAANKLITAGSKSYAYDLAGNVQSVSNAQTGVTTNLAWDAQSRLTGVTGPTTATSASYSYNALDQRIGKMSNGSTFAYTHQDDAVDSAVLSDGQATYQHGLGLISEVRNGASSFYKTDDLGSTRALTNAGGATTDEQTTDAFGNTISASGSVATPFGFAGQCGYKTDTETGLMLLGHRYYDPSTGRFLSRDPIVDGYNWYTYCDNDPVNDADPKGLQRDKNGKPANGARHMAGGSGDNLSIDIGELPKPTVELPQIPVPKGGDGKYPVDVSGGKFNFHDGLIGNVGGHFIGTVTVKDGVIVSTDGKFYPYPDLYNVDIRPWKRGDIIRNLLTEGLGGWIDGNAIVGGTDAKEFHTYIQGYVPIHNR